MKICERTWACARLAGIQCGRRFLVCLSICCFVKGIQADNWCIWRKHSLFDLLVCVDVSSDQTAMYRQCPVTQLRTQIKMAEIP